MPKHAVYQVLCLAEQDSGQCSQQVKPRHIYWPSLVQLSV